MVEAELWRTNWTPLHDPLEAPPGFGVRQSSGALALDASQPKAPEDWRSPRRYRAIRRFRVPTPAEVTKGLSTTQKWEDGISKERTKSMERGVSLYPLLPRRKSERQTSDAVSVIGRAPKACQRARRRA